MISTESDAVEWLVSSLPERNGSREELVAFKMTIEELRTFSRNERRSGTKPGRRWIN